MEEALIEIQSLMKDLVEKNTVSRDLSILPSCSYYLKVKALRTNAHEHKVLCGQKYSSFSHLI